MWVPTHIRLRERPQTQTDVYLPVELQFCELQHAKHKAEMEYLFPILEGTSDNFSMGGNILLLA